MLSRSTPHTYIARPAENYSISQGFRVETIFESRAARVCFVRQRRRLETYRRSRHAWLTNQRSPIARNRASAR